MSKEKKDGQSAVRTIRIVALAVAALCAAYIAWWFVDAGRNRAESEQTLAQYVTQAAAPTPAETASAGTEEASGTEPDGPEPTALPAASPAGEDGDMAVDFDALRQTSGDVVGWITVAGLDQIDYPVVQRDDFYYLHHAWNGSWSSYGAIFMEAANTADFSDYHTILYGHRMRNGSMFGHLTYYDDPDFFAENGGLITVYTPAGTRRYQIFAVEYVDHDDPGCYTVGFSPSEEYEQFLTGMMSRALYDTGVSVTAQDRVLTLSTCAYLSKDRFVVHAKLLTD